MTGFFWAAGLILVGAVIAAIALDLPAGIVIAIILPSSLVVLYAAYGSARLLRIPQKVKERAKKHKHLKRFVEDYHFRKLVYACFSVVVDFGYAAMEFVFSRVSGNNWYTVNATYYFGLAAIRLGIIFFGAGRMKKIPEEKRRLHEIKTYTATGIALLLLNGWLTTTFIASLSSDGEFKKYSLIVYATAIYTFYRIVFSIAGLIKSHIDKSLITRSLVALSTVAALVSVLTFFAALAATFSELRSVLVANGIIGNIISAFNISMSVFIIFRSYRLNKKLQEQGGGESDGETE